MALGLQHPPSCACTRLAPKAERRQRREEALIPGMASAKARDKMEQYIVRLKMLWTNSRQRGAYWQRQARKLEAELAARDEEDREKIGSTDGAHTAHAFEHRLANARNIGHGSASATYAVCSREYRHDPGDAGLSRRGRVLRAEINLDACLREKWVEDLFSLRGHLSEGDSTLRWTITRVGADGTNSNIVTGWKAMVFLAEVFSSTGNSIGGVADLQKIVHSTAFECRSILEKQAEGLGLSWAEKQLVVVDDDRRQVTTFEVFFMMSDAGGDMAKSVAQMAVESSGANDADNGATATVTAHSQQSVAAVSTCAFAWSNALSCAQPAMTLIPNCAS